MCYDSTVELATIQTHDRFRWAHMEGVATEQACRRRSVRMVMRVPLFVNPVDAPVTSEWEAVETMVISLHGGLLCSRQQFPVGTVLDIRMRNVERFTRGRVVWTALRPAGTTFEVGFETLDPGFWEISFLEDRWSGTSRSTNS